MNQKTQSNMFVRWKAKWSRNALVISLLAHGGFILLALTWVAFRGVIPPDIGDFKVNVKPRQDRVQKPSPVKQPDLPKLDAKPQIPHKIMVLKPANQQIPPVTMPVREQTISLVDKGPLGPLGQVKWGPIFTKENPIDVPKPLAGRCTPQERFRLLRANGAGPEVDVAVTKALDWFKATQNEDGSWGDAHETAMTGMALLAFMGRCETVKSKEYGRTVERAIDFLVSHGRENKGRLWAAKGKDGKFVAGERPGNHGSYEHGIVTLALADTYSITKIAKIKPVLEDAVRIIIEGQSDISLWHYGYGKNGADLSVTGWQIQALKAAKVAGVNVGGLDTALRNAVDSIRKLQAEDGSFPYQTQSVKEGENKGKSSITGIGLLCSQMLDVKPPRDMMSRSVDHILEKHAGSVGRRGGFGFYTMYYDTYGIFLSGDRWEMWNELFREPLIQAQAADGSWAGQPPKEVKLGQAKEPVAYQTVLDTAFGTLMLEVYYRYLPSAGG